MLQNSGMICLWKFELLQRYHVSKGDLKPTCFRSLSLLSFLSLPNTDDPLVTTLLWFSTYDSYIMIGWCALEFEIKHMDTWYLMSLMALRLALAHQNP